VTAEPGERRRVRYRLRSAPMRVAQQFLAALARDWDGPLDVLTDHLDRSARRPTATPIPRNPKKSSLIKENDHGESATEDRHTNRVATSPRRTPHRRKRSHPHPRHTRHTAADTSP